MSLAGTNWDRMRVRATFRVVPLEFCAQRYAFGWHLYEVVPNGGFLTLGFGFYTEHQTTVAYYAEKDFLRTVITTDYDCFVTQARFELEQRTRVTRLHDPGEYKVVWARNGEDGAARAAFRIQSQDPYRRFTPSTQQHHMSFASQHR